MRKIIIASMLVAACDTMPTPLPDCDSPPPAETSSDTGTEDTAGEPPSDGPGWCCACSQWGGTECWEATPEGCEAWSMASGRKAEWCEVGCAQECEP